MPENFILRVPGERAFLPLQPPLSFMSLLSGEAVQEKHLGRAEAIDTGPLKN